MVPWYTIHLDTNPLNGGIPEMVAQEKDLNRMNKILQALTNERQIELDKLSEK